MVDLKGKLELAGINIKSIEIVTPELDVGDDEMILKGHDTFVQLKDGFWMAEAVQRYHELKATG